MRVLLVKMSSLGDVVHALPAVTEAARHDIEFHWVVEEAFAPIVECHEAVERVIRVAWRRWRSSLLDSRAEMIEFVGELRRERYDLVLDAQGLWKSAIAARLARASSRAGFDRSSAREGTAAILYQQRHRVPRQQHAVERLRSLFAAALDFEVAGDVPGFGLQAPSLPAPSLPATPAQAADGLPICVLCHGTTWSSKQWPEAMWQALAQELLKAGYQLRIPAGSAAELSRAHRIAALSDEAATVLDAMPLSELMAVFGQAALVVGVDSGLTHLAGALGRPTVVIYGSTDAELTGARGERVTNLSSTLPCSPCRSRECDYTGVAQYWHKVPVNPACYSLVTPAMVMRAIEEL